MRFRIRAARRGRSVCSRRATRRGFIALNFATARRFAMPPLRPAIRLLIPCARIFIFSIFDGSDGTADSCPRNCVTSLVPTWHQSVHAEPIIHHITSSHTLFSRVNYYYYFFVKNDSLPEIGCIGQASDGSSAMACGVPLGYRRRGDEGETLGESERKREK